MSKITLSLKLTALLPVLVAAGAVLTACGSGTSALPGGTSTSSSTSASSKASDTWFTSVKSCNLLDQSQATALGFATDGSVIHNDPTENSCDYSQTQFGDMQVVLEPLPYSPLKDPVAASIDVTVAGRPGQMALDPVGGCDLTVEATSGSRLQIITSLIHGNGDQACSIAKQVAQDIAPKLPSLSG